MLEYYGIDVSRLAFFAFSAHPQNLGGKKRYIIRERSSPTTETPKIILFDIPLLKSSKIPNPPVQKDVMQDLL